MDKEKHQLSVEVARLYYQMEYSQQDIANQLNISRPTVSRLLKYAKDKGYIQIKIVDPFSDMTSLSRLLKEKYDLLDVQVVFAPTMDYPVLTEYISKATAEYLEKTVTNGDIIGVSWGTTMHEVARKMKPKEVKGVEVVQLKGGISHSSVNTYATETLNLFADAFQTVGRQLPLPVIFDHPEVKKMVEEDRHIKRIIELGRQATIAVFTVGTVRDEALLFRLGYFDKEEENLLKKKAVGDICSRFFDSNGNICSETIDNRTIGIDLNELKMKEKSILVAGGMRKIRAIDGALNGKYANILITDQYTAQALLDFDGTLNS
ncbi:sugar-binding transcriptional regulator [Isobaculum melis]|uniref:Deoxyribonucleoside regulator n=1 Tax=Isobaculum melis TaxID=142588 RepID=A0A1H9TYH6_9LACT|nr:sugar-binding transcriptional regulator [Isobaculum melis]SES02305.1 deoxyribonucleoside regulator [Isobaculum melis]